jgi:iron complex outermembrane receptor protein
MVYLLTASGFLPGTASLSPGMGGVWNILILEQQELVSYEVGSKNQFLDNTLRLNTALFYYDYEGYPEAVNVNPGGGPPTFTVMPIELDIMGLELEAEWLITPYDKLSLTAGYLKTEIAKVPESMVWEPMAPPWGDPEDPAYQPYETPGSYAFMLDELPGYPEVTATLAYDHTFHLGDGSMLVPRAEVVYTGEYYIGQLNYLQVPPGALEGEDPTREADDDLTPYNKRDALTLVNIGATWTSSNQMLSITGYGRNVFDELYKQDVLLRTTSGTTGIQVTPGDPQTWGLIVSVKY